MDPTRGHASGPCSRHISTTSPIGFRRSDQGTMSRSRDNPYLGPMRHPCPIAIMEPDRYQPRARDGATSPAGRTRDHQPFARFAFVSEPRGAMIWLSVLAVLLPVRVPDQQPPGCEEGTTLDPATGRCVPVEEPEPTVAMAKWECPAGTDPQADWAALTGIRSTPTQTAFEITHGWQGGIESTQQVTGEAAWTDLPPGSHYLYEGTKRRQPDTRNLPSGAAATSPVRPPRRSARCPSPMAATPSATSCSTAKASTAAGSTRPSSRTAMSRRSSAPARTTSCPT